MKQLTVLFLILFAFASCNDSQSKESNKNTEQKALKNITKFDTTTKTIHIYVALCDNKYQGIVPVPPKIGNGQNPNSNLYWGCSFGIRTYFKKSKEWDLIKSQKLDSIRLERLVFKHKQKNTISLLMPITDATSNNAQKISSKAVQDKQKTL